ncbi:hypothetical protein GA0070216_109147 [Micromonospora matsumotoense]|uniref:Uncharacterized protein n=1 Tax=Micromonospora matsumotoense TaxID=121616 RepID=A0A1C4ZFE6_9ACTN|nr:hypothetical protein [Micromonospora matsumotoense]SCF31471.1 hypothetical protein GA0070216_109147 [Micromonospora matsumotoense]
MQPPAGSQVSRVPAQRTPPDQLAPPAPLPVPQRRPRRLRTVLTVVAGVLALLCVGGGVTGYVLYERAATPDRSAPDVVVDNYLREFLVNDNDTRAELLVCDDPDLKAVAALREELRQREQNYNVVVRVGWGPLTRLKTSAGESVTTTLTIAGSSDGQQRSSRREDWTFEVIDIRDGWRVCGARKGA